MARIVGFVWFVGAFVAHLVLLGYYSAKRPVVPRPEQGMTVGLMWTHPTRYGTEADERRSHWLFDMGLPSFLLIAFSGGIEMYKLGDYSFLRRRENPPWNHKWGP
jgi:hypothetical protein